MSSAFVALFHTGLFRADEYLTISDVLRSQPDDIALPHAGMEQHRHCQSGPGAAWMPHLILRDLGFVPRTNAAALDLCALNPLGWVILAQSHLNRELHQPAQGLEQVVRSKRLFLAEQYQKVFSA